MTQPELDLGLTPSERHHRGEGETGGTRERKPVDPNAVVWRRVHTKEQCTSCISEVAAALAGEGGAHVPWSASYVRTEGTTREALCFTHAAPRRHREGLQPQRSSDPNAPSNRKPKPRTDTYE